MGDVSPRATSQALLSCPCWVLRSSRSVRILSSARQMNILLVSPASCIPTITSAQRRHLPLHHMTPARHAHFHAGKPKVSPWELRRRQRGGRVRLMTAVRSTSASEVGGAKRDVTWRQPSFRSHMWIHFMFMRRLLGESHQVIARVEGDWLPQIFHLSHTSNDWQQKKGHAPCQRTHQWEVTCSRRGSDTWRALSVCELIHHFQLQYQTKFCTKHDDSPSSYYEDSQT